MLTGAPACAVLLLQFMPPAGSPAWDPRDFTLEGTPSVGAPACEAVSPPDVMLSLMYGFYRNVVSPVNGSNCPMYPSCSRFSRLAIEELGVTEGLLATFDRLHRCGHDLRFYELVMDDGRWLRYDPPAAWRISS